MRTVVIHAADAVLDERVKPLNRLRVNVDRVCHAVIVAEGATNIRRSTVRPV